MLVGTLKPKAEPRNLGEYPVLPLSGEWTTKGGLGESGSEDAFRQNGNSQDQRHIYTCVGMLSMIMIMLCWTIKVSH